MLISDKIYLLLFIMSCYYSIRGGRHRKAVCMRGGEMVVEYTVTRALASFWMTWYSGGEGHMVLRQENGVVSK